MVKKLIPVSKTDFAHLHINTSTLFPFYSIGHFINQPENPTEFEITVFGEMEEPEIEDPHKHTFYEIIWIEKGVSRQVIDYQEYELNPNTLFFISPGQLHHFEEWQALEGGSIMFTEDFFLLNQQNQDKLFELSFLDNFYISPYLQPDAKNLSEILHTIELLKNEKKRDTPSDPILQALLHILLLQIQRCIEAVSEAVIPKKYLVLFKKFKNLLDKHFPENLTSGQYASMLNITQHHLNFIIKQITGNTAGQVIRARSILEAKRLLTFTDATIAEIAAQLGFFDSSYFAKLFRAETGTSPLDFKTSISEKYRRK